MAAKNVRVSKRNSKLPATSGDGGRIAIENVNVPGRSTRVDAAKYEAMRSALLKTLPDKPPGLTQAEMFAAVLPFLPAAFPEAPKPGGGPRRFSWISKPGGLSLARTPSLCAGTGVKRRRADGY